MNLIQTFQPYWKAQITGTYHIMYLKVHKTNLFCGQYITHYLQNKLIIRIIMYEVLSNISKKFNIPHKPVI